MKHGTKILIISLLLVVGSLSFVPAVQAQVIGNWDFLKGIVPCSTSYAKAPCTVCHFYKLLQNIINFLLYTTAALATLMAIYIAFLFLFSGGNPKIISDAKSKLRPLIWGIVWVLGSWLVLNTIITVFANPSLFRLPWYQISC